MAPAETTEYDVVVGGGPAACSTAVLTARYGPETLVRGRGHSSTQQCAFIENYLGSPGGTDVDTLYTMSQAHVERVGATVVEDAVTALSRATDGFHVETQDGASAADRVVAPSPSGVSYPAPLLGDHVDVHDGEGWLDSDLAGDRGETPVDGLWLAGPTAGVERRLAVAVGHGTRVGVALIEEQLDEHEVDRRTDRPRQRLLEHVDDDLIRGYAASLDAAEVSE